MIHWEYRVREYQDEPIAYVNELTHALLLAGKKTQVELPPDAKIRVYAHGYWKGTGWARPWWQFWKKRTRGPWTPFIPDGRAILMHEGRVTALVLWPEHEPGPGN